MFHPETLSDKVSITHFTMTEGDLGSEGNHASVFNIGDNTNYITNSCLAYIQCLMPARDKQYIKGKTCSIFSLNQLREAREKVFKYHDPNMRYKYNGPHSKNERDKILDAFEGIYTKLTKLDAEKKMPTFTVSSADLLLLLNHSVPEKAGEGKKHEDCERKFNYIEKQLEEVKQTFHSFVTVVTSKSQPMPPVTSIPPMVRNRLISTGSKRSSSEISDDDEDDNTVIAESEAASIGGFTIPRKHQQKKKRAKRNSVTEKQGNDLKSSYSTAVKQPRDKPPSTWGTVKANSSLKGAVPEVFLYNCDCDVTKDDVAEYFQTVNISIKKVEKMSHENSQRKSFKLSPKTHADYDQILEGNKLPEGIAARKYIPPKWKPKENRITQSQVSNAFRSTEIQDMLNQSFNSFRLENNTNNAMDTQVEPNTQ